MTDPLPERDACALTFIVRTVRQKGCPPTVREIASHIGHASTSGAQAAVKSLAEAGYLKPSRGRRAIQLTERARRAVGIPILGTVPAGRPVFAFENFQGVLTLESRYESVDGLFALRVKGVSMRDAGIHDGDFVIVRPQAVVDGGDIGVAFIGDEATVKRIHKLRTGWKLEPANPDFASELVPWDDPAFRIGGKVVGVFRSL